MSDYLARLAERAVGAARSIRPLAGIAADAAAWSGGDPVAPIQGAGERSPATELPPGDRRDVPPPEVVSVVTRRIDRGTVAAARGGGEQGGAAEHVRPRVAPAHHRAPAPAAVASPRADQEMAVPPRSTRDDAPEAVAVVSPGLEGAEASGPVPAAVETAVGERAFLEATDAPAAPRRLDSDAPEVSWANAPATNARQELDRPRPVARGTPADAAPPIPRASRREHARADVAPPVVRVTIGRIEVRAPLAPPEPARTRAPAAAQALTLDDYLRGRGRGGW